MRSAPLVTWQFAADSRTILALDADGNVITRSGAGFQGNEQLFRIDGPGIRDQSVVPANAYVARFSPDSRWLAVGSYSGVVQIWDVARRSLAREITGESGEVLPAGFCDGSNRLVVSQRSHFRYREYDLASGRQVASWPGPELFSKHGWAISSDGNSYLMIGLDGRAKLRDMRTGTVAAFDLDIREPEAAVFSSDGAYFASGSQYGTGKMWETRTRREVAAFTNARGDMHSFAFSPDGSRIASGGLNASEAVRLWDFASHQPLLTLSAQGSSFRQAAFAPDGNTVGAVNLAGILHLWRAPTWEEIGEQEKPGPRKQSPP
jgi:WD40 repeat protein